MQQVRHATDGVLYPEALLHKGHDLLHREIDVLPQMGLQGLPLGLVEMAKSTHVAVLPQRLKPSPAIPCQVVPDRVLIEQQGLRDLCRRPPLTEQHYRFDAVSLTPSLRMVPAYAGMRRLELGDLGQG